MNQLFLDRMKELLNDEYDDFIASLNQPPVKGFYLNPLKKDVLNHLNQEHITPHPYIPRGYYFDYEKEPLGKSPYFMCGLYYIQEPSAMAVANTIQVNKDDYILDMCGAPGGKTCYLASQLNQDGLMIANDINKLRAHILASNIERFGLKNTIVTNVDPLRFSLPGFFDKVILDAPCSGEGMFRKNDEAIETWSLQKVQEYAYIQRNLIDQAYKLLKKDGILVYSTCTYSVEENEAQVNYMVNELNMEVIPIHQEPGMTESTLCPGTVRMYPHHNRGEGQFIAVVKKTTDTLVEKPKILKPNITREQLKLVETFYHDHLNIDVPPYLFQSQQHIYAIRPQFPDLNKIKVIKNGLYLGECKKGRFEPSLSLALTLEKKDVKRYYDFSKDSQEVQDYIKGLTLKGHGDKGYGVIFVDGYPLSFYKESNQQVKNLFPKGLRR